MLNISSPTHSLAYLHHCTQDTISLNISRLQPGQVAFISSEKISTSSPQRGQIFISRVGDFRLDTPGHVCIIPEI